MSLATARHSLSPQESGPTMQISKTALQPSSLSDPKRQTRQSAPITLCTKRRDGRRHNSCSPSSPTPGSANCKTLTRYTPRLRLRKSFPTSKRGATAGTPSTSWRCITKCSEYINMLEDAQRQSGRAGRTISDETLLLFSSTAMLTSERFPRANDDWKERAERDKTWPQRKSAYKRAHTKA